MRRMSAILLMLLSSVALAKVEELNCTLTIKDEGKIYSDNKLNLKISKDHLIAKSEKGFYNFKNDTEMKLIKTEKLNYITHSWYASVEVKGNRPAFEDAKEKIKIDAQTNSHWPTLVYLARTEKGEIKIYVHRLRYSDEKINFDDSNGVCRP